MTGRELAWGLWLFAALCLAPIGASLLYVACYSVGLAGLLAQGFTLAHWSAVLGGAELWRSLALSVAIAGGVVLASAGLGLAIALGFGGALERRPLAWCLPLPLALPSTVAALLVFLLFGGVGWVPRVLVALGWRGGFDAGFSLVQDPWSAGIVAAHVFLATPFLALAFRSLHRSERLDELARVAAALGAGAVQRTARVVLPVLLRRAAPTLAFVFILVLGSYEIPLVLGRQSPQMLSVLVMRKYARFDLAEKPEAMVVALVYSALVCGVVAWAFRTRAPAEMVQ